MKILEIENLKKRYTDFILDIDYLSLEEGFVMGLIGPNGAGKTTLLKCLMNLVVKDSGTIRIFGKKYDEHEQEIKSAMGFVHDEPDLWEELTPLAIGKVTAGFYPEWDPSLYRRFLEGFQIPGEKKFKKLSRGMKMKCYLAAALSHNARLILLDEPAAGLDPVARNEFLRIIADQLQDERKSFIISSHITSDLDKIADYVTLIKSGRIVLQESRNDLLDRFYICKGKLELLKNGANSLFVNIRKNEFGFEGLTEKIDEVRKNFGDSVVIERPNLEKLMIWYL